MFNSEAGPWGSGGEALGESYDAEEGIAFGGEAKGMLLCAGVETAEGVTWESSGWKVGGEGASVCHGTGWLPGVPASSTSGGKNDDSRNGNPPMKVGLAICWGKIGCSEFGY
ncbi:hypothetical protein DL93DRAFT_2103703 [Clavulina sp. PMI_390]|nr:hypothetical protein DL93DRAFT_2103703 [Clavulina sp. PMI_390]